MDELQDACVNQLEDTSKRGCVAGYAIGGRGCVGRLDLRRLIASQTDSVICLACKLDFDLLGV